MKGILLDQGLPRTAAKILKEKGWDVLHTGDIGLSRASDNEILPRCCIGNHLDQLDMLL